MVYWSNVKKHYTEDTYKKYLDRIKQSSEGRKKVKVYDRILKQRKQFQDYHRQRQQQNE